MDARPGHPQPQPRDRPPPPEAGPQARPLGPQPVRPAPGEGDGPSRSATRSHTKSSLMVGLGETRDELTEAFEALRAVDVDILTIGQYLRPSLAAPAARALLPPRRVRRDEGRGPGPRLQARRIGARSSARATTPATRCPGAELKRAAPPGDDRRRGPRRPGGRLTSVRSRPSLAARRPTRPHSSRDGCRHRPVPAGREPSATLRAVPATPARARSPSPSSTAISAAR